MTCPVSWLRLEQHALGELADPLVEGHLADCPACRDRLASIHRDVRALPPLVVPQRRSRMWLAPLALAAAAVLVVLARPAAELPGPSVKGGTLAVALVRERAGIRTSSPATFAPGDRFQVQVTCPPSADVQIAVLEDGAITLPLPPPACGNGVVAGALGLTGDGPVAICAVAGVPAAVLLRDGQAALGDDAACAVLARE